MNSKSDSASIRVRREGALLLGGLLAWLVLLLSRPVLGAEAWPGKERLGRFRATLPADAMLVYSVDYGDDPSPRSYQRPPRAYVLSEDLIEPGLWGAQVGFYQHEPQVVGEEVFAGRKVRVTDGDWASGWAWQGHGISDQHYGALEYFRPGLFGLPDAGDMDHPILRPSPLHASWPPVRDPAEPGSWKVSGWFNIRYEQGKRVPSPCVFTFRESDGLCTRIEVDGASVDGEDWDPRVICDKLSFLLRSREAFPPPDLDARVAKAIRTGAEYLARHADDAGKTPWSSTYPAGVRALIAWGILQGGGDRDRAAELLERAIAAPSSTTYDFAFLILALDALLARGRDVAGRGGATPRTAVAGPLEDERKVAGVMKRSAAALMALRVGKLGLWGYRSSAPFCEDLSKRAFTYCDGLWDLRRGQEIADTSNTFWALDALRVAQARGIAVPKAVWIEAARMLERWGTTLKSWYPSVEDLSHMRPEDLAPSQRLRLERRDLDLTLRFRRRLRLPCPGEGLTIPAGAASETTLRPGRFRIWFYSYSSYPGTDFPFGRLVYSNVYPSQIGGVGALALAYLGAGADPLAQPTVQESLLWARMFFRLSLGAGDIAPGEDSRSRDPNLGPRCSTAAAGNVGYNFLVIERLFDLLGIEELGRHRWFPLLALHALDFQEEDGGWIPWRGDRLVPTALFVLALSRSRASDPGVSLPRYTLGPIATGNASSDSRTRLLFVQEGDGAWLYGPDVVAALRSSSSAARLALARKAIDAADEAQKAAYVEILVRVFEDGPAASKAFAKAELAMITGIQKGTPESWIEWVRAQRRPQAAPSSG